MRGFQKVLVAVTCLFSAHVAIAGETTSVAAAPEVRAPSRPAYLPHAGVDDALNLDVLDLSTVVLGEQEAPDGVAESHRQSVVHMPPAPSSTALLLSAMLSLGAWQVLRSAAHIQLAPIPDWYHTGGPAQVGHATPLDLDFGNLALCLFKAPVVEPDNAVVEVRRSDDARSAHEQFHLSSRTPRAPPASL